MYSGNAYNAYLSQKSNVFKLFSNTATNQCNKFLEIMGIGPIIRYYEMSFPEKAAITKRLGLDWVNSLPKLSSTGKG